MREVKIIDNILYLKCSHCGKYLTQDFFNPKKRSRYNAQSRCKKCQLKAIKKYKSNNLDKYREYGKLYKQIHKDKITKKYIEQHKFYNEKYGFNRLNFHQKANKYAKKHHLYPKQCPICNKSLKIIIHHPFYDKFEDRSKVIFYCSSCHNKIHQNKIHISNFIDLTKLKNG